MVLLRPAPDLDTSLQVLRERCLLTKGHDWQIGGVDYLARWLSDGCDEQLATDVVHNAAEQPLVTARRIAALPVHRPVWGSAPRPSTRREPCASPAPNATCPALPQPRVRTVSVPRS